MAIYDTFIPVFFHITVSNMTGAAPKDGFIDHNNPQDYSSFPSTLNSSLAKERARMRYEGMLQQLSSKIIPDRTLNIEAVGADEDTEATSFEITIEYSRPEYVQTEDEDNPGTILEGADAVKRFVARMLISTYILNREIYDPSVVSGQIVGPRIQEVIAEGPATDLTDAESNITVIMSDLTT